jgi:hypothetical protein
MRLFFDLGLWFLLFNTAVFSSDYANACSWRTQRPDARNETIELFNLGDSILDSLFPTDNLTPSPEGAIDGFNNLSVFALGPIGTLPSAALKIGNTNELGFYRRGLEFVPRKMARYVAVHLSLGDMKLAPQLRAMVHQDSLISLFDSVTEFSDLMELRTASRELTFFTGEPIGLVMDRLFRIHHLSRDRRPPHWMENWCDSHVLRALNELVEIRKRVIEAGIFLNDQQIVVNSEGHVYLIDVDDYRFNERQSIRTNFIEEAHRLLERYETSTHKVFNREVFSEFEQRLQEQFLVCSQPVLQPWVDFRNTAPINCDEEEQSDGQTLTAFISDEERVETFDQSGESSLFVEAGATSFNRTEEMCYQNHNLICYYNENYELRAFNITNLTQALNLLQNIDLEVTPEGFVVAGGAVTTVALVVRYARSFNPFGAFLLGLGVAPAAASDYCSIYSNNEGLDYFINELSHENQIQELRNCPEFMVNLISIFEQIDGVSQL